MQRKRTKAMASTDRSLSLDYPALWASLGIVTAVEICRDQEECAGDSDPHPEHYRWRAFRRFLAKQQALAPSLAHQLIALGEADADHAMGGSMMAMVLRRADCPLELLRAALTSERPHIRRIATQRLNHDGQSAT